MSNTSQTDIEVDRDPQSQNSIDTHLRIAQALDNRLAPVLDDVELPENVASNTEDEEDVFSDVEHAEIVLDWSNSSQTAIDVDQYSHSKDSSDLWTAGIKYSLNWMPNESADWSNTSQTSIDVGQYSHSKDSSDLWTAGINYSLNWMPNESAGWSNTSQTSIDVDQYSHSKDSSDLWTASINCSAILPPAAAAASGYPSVMTRSQQPDPHQWTWCPRSFMNNTAVQRHEWEHLHKENGHPGKSATMVHKNVDLQDSQVYSSNGALHTAQPSENVPLFEDVWDVCDICGEMVFKTKWFDHLDLHKVRGKYVCDICRKVLKTALNLYRHKVNHGEPLLCDVCGLRFPTTRHLRAHSISHRDRRPYKCTICNQSFKRSHSLQFHMNRHTGAKPYQCPYCPKAFSSSSNCFRHRRTAHWTVTMNTQQEF